MALEIGALPWGHWSGCHSVQWDLNAPWHGDRKVGDNFQKYSYPLGLIVNLKGERFVDEGADFRNYTYVKYGRAVIGQPRRTAFQIFDQKVLHNLREEYRIREVTKAEDMTLDGLARKLEIDVDGFVATVRAYNASLRAGDYNPAIKDGKATHGITPPKPNWIGSKQFGSSPCFQAPGTFTSRKSFRCPNVCRSSFSVNTRQWSA